MRTGPGTPRAGGIRTVSAAGEIPQKSLSRQDCRREAVPGGSIWKAAIAFSLPDRPGLHGRWNRYGYAPTGPDDRPPRAGYGRRGVFR